jgi:hypothetical protein
MIVGSLPPTPVVEWMNRSCVESLYVDDANFDKHELMLSGRLTVDVLNFLMYHMRTIEGITLYQTVWEQSSQYGGKIETAVFGPRIKTLSIVDPPYRTPLFFISSRCWDFPKLSAVSIAGVYLGNEQVLYLAVMMRKYPNAKIHLNNNACIEDAALNFPTFCSPANYTIQVYSI